MVKMYGIPNCDSVKKASTWLLQNNIAFELHDYKKEGITIQKLKEWSRICGWQTIFNKRSTTWKDIAKTQGSEISGEADALKIMQKNNSIIKRPGIEINTEIIVGFDESAYIEKILHNNHKLNFKK